MERTTNLERGWSSLLAANESLVLAACPRSVIAPRFKAGRWAGQETRTIAQTANVMEPKSKGQQLESKSTRARSAKRSGHENRTKHLGLTKLRTLVAKDFQLMIRVEAADSAGNCQCVTCGKIDHYSEMNAGHWISRTRFNVLFDERNISVQCPNCNNPANSGDVGPQYAFYMLKTYGDEVMQDLLRLSQLKANHTKEQLLEMRAGFKQRINVVQQN